MTATVSGEALFARFAYPPNELGYCGPPDSDAVMAAANSSPSRPVPDFRARARAFDGAWVYLKEIAAATGLDPLDPQVVEAYWIGNGLLDQVDPVSFTSAVRSRFAGETGADWGALDGDKAAYPHHSFQVFVVYPWVRLLDRGAAALRVLDRCRIRTGTVQSIDGATAVVRSRPLTWDGRDIGEGPAMDETARWADHGRSLLGAVHEGDTVALHWDWICDRLTVAQVAALQDRNRHQLRLTNRRRGER